MTKDKKNKIITIIVFLIFFMIGYFVISSYNKDTRKMKTLTKETTGVVTDYNYYSKVLGAKYSHTVYYHEIGLEYIIDGKTYRTNNKHLGEKTKMYSVGEKVKVLYDPSDPEGAIPEKTVEYNLRYDKGQKLFIATLVFIIGLLSVRYYTKIGKQKKLK